MKGFYDQCFARDEVRALMVGLSGAGKSYLFESYKRRYLRDTSSAFRRAAASYTGIPWARITPTIGLNFAKLPMKGLDVIMWDVGGTVRARACASHSFVPTPAHICTPATIRCRCKRYGTGIALMQMYCCLWWIPPRQTHWMLPGLRLVCYVPAITRRAHSRVRDTVCTLLTLSAFTHTCGGLQRACFSIQAFSSRRQWPLS